MIWKVWADNPAQNAQYLTPVTAVGPQLKKGCRPAVELPPLEGSSHFRTIGELKRGFLSDLGSRVAFSLEAAGIRHLSNSKMAIKSSQAATTIGDGLHRQRQEEVRSGFIPLVSPGTRNSAGSNYQHALFLACGGKEKSGLARRG